jgi:hypothetical protein
MEEFCQEQACYAIVYFDGKLIKDLIGTLKENLAILVSGASHNLEGKILCVSNLMDNDDNPTSFGRRGYLYENSKPCKQLVTR